MSEQYLILHKVRGEPAFDVAHKMAVDGEEWWIVTTSGHRAHPYDSWPLVIPTVMVSMPDDWPDHYAAKQVEPSTDSISLEALGIGWKPPQNRRRSLG